MKKSKLLKAILRLLSFVGVFLVMVIVTLYSVMLLICYGPSMKARDTFVTTFLETGALKFVVKLVLPKAKIEEIVKNNSLEEMATSVDTNLIDVTNASDEIETIKISGLGYMGTLMIIHDPSRVKVATTYPFSEYGKTLDKIVEEHDAIGGVNGGIYVSTGNAGGYPMGVVVSSYIKENPIVWNNPHGKGYYIIGFDEDNVLRIISLEGKSVSDVEKLVKEEKIRDAVTFQEETTGDNNHFVKLIINGEKREIKGKGSGSNPRTVIGQREDDAVLLLVVDGRASGGNLGATASDLIDIMDEYGAVNAANIDGGSSSCMYYQDEYLMTSVTFYYSTSSWRLPEAFVVTK